MRVRSGGRPNRTTALAKQEARRTMYTSKRSCEMQDFLSYMMHHFDPQLHVVEESGRLVGGMLKHLDCNKESLRRHNVVEYFISERFGKRDDKT